MIDPSSAYPCCPACETGTLVPLNPGGGSHALWVCTQPACTYVIGNNSGRATFHKGHAVASAETVRDGRRWTTFTF